MNAGLAIQTQDLGRVYKLRGPKQKGDPKTLIALEGVNLEVHKGELFGLLGPNGAGKTTLIKILATLLLPTSGTALVEDLDVVRDVQEIRRRISMVSGGETSGYGLLTVQENLWMFARFYGLDNATARRRIDGLLEVVGIADRKRTKISDLSTGLRQKMNFIRGFISDPNVVFLDEPTLGLDVTAARDVRGFVKQWMKENTDKTILLTTHYMAEADELCDRLAIIDKGRLLACDTPQNLKHRLQQDAIFNLKVGPLGPKPSRDDMLEAVPGVRQVSVAEQNGHTELNLILAQEDVLSGVLAHLNRRGSSLISLEKREPTLEDVFVNLVGRRLDVDTSHKEDGENAQ
ncbi:MAG TPA: ABC transporter ATP-binding protein [Phototrophicaceae bacterium]|nr:ABC transporter ATP-binding protein [Phototrophicaceae bacterium]